MSPKSSGAVAERPAPAVTEDAPVECDHKDPAIAYIDAGDESGWSCTRCGEPFVPLAAVGGHEVLEAAREVIDVSGRNDRSGGRFAENLRMAVDRLRRAIGG